MQDNKCNTAVFVLCVEWWWSSATCVGCCRAHHVIVKYVGVYLTGGKMSERRRLEQNVRFGIRNDKKGISNI